MRIPALLLAAGLCAGAGPLLDFVGRVFRPGISADLKVRPTNSGTQETCGVVVKVSGGCSAELAVKARDLSFKVVIPADARAAFPPIKSTYMSAQVCVAAVPPKPGKSFTVEARNPRMIRLMNAAPAMEFGAGAYEQHTPGLVAPTLLRNIVPKYTSDAMHRKVQGDVELEAVVRTDGTVADIRITQSLDPCGLDDEAIDAAKQWRFSPALKDGQPVAVRVGLVVTFRLR